MVKAQYRIWLALSVSVLLSACANLVANTSYSYPLQIPIDLAVPTAVSTGTFNVPRRSVFLIELHFDYDKNNRENIANLSQLLGSSARSSGGRLVDPGIETPIRIALDKIEGAKLISIFYLESVTPEYSGGVVGTSKIRQIRRLILEPGIYRITANSIVERKEFANFGVSLVAAIDPRAVPGPRP